MTDVAAREEAIGWTIRLRSAAPADWEAFTSWLEADPAHAAAYDLVTLADAEMVDAVSAIPAAPEPVAVSTDEPAVAANDNAPGFFRRYGALAAALLVCVMAYPAYRVLVPTYVVETALGETRTVTLDDGSVINLNGGTRLVLDRRNARIASLEAGEARFHVVHDPANPFAVTVGGADVVDVGTIFNITREGAQTEVSVAEGAVIFNPKREAVMLRPGDRLRVEGSGKPAVVRVDPGEVGGWTSGRLDYAAVRIGDIAPDLARALGVPVAADPAIADRAFTGTIIVDRQDRDAVGKVAALMGVSAKRTEQGWRLSGQ